jgi:hypothetical protein
METTNRNIIITAIILVVIFCLCCCVITAGGLVVWSVFPEFSGLSTPGASAYTLPPTPRPTITPSASSTDAPGGEIPPYVAAQMDIIEEEVRDLRGLSPSQPVERALLSPEQLQQRVIDDFLADYTPEEVQRDVLVLSLFGLLEPGFDLLTLYEKLLTEQIAGFYDDETEEMYVVQAQAFQGLERMTYAHEYTHVLQDQVYNFDEGLQYNEDACEADSERCAAIQALIEGDATLAEFEWFQTYSTAEDQQQVMDFYNSYQSPVYDSAPEFLKQDFLFPYEKGLTFVQALHDQGGWQAVDNAYRTLPTSTEQILHPQKYPAEQPITVALPDFGALLGDGWSELDRGVMGEWYTILILAYGSDPASRLAQDVAETAAAGWGGDSYVVYHHEGDAQSVMVLHAVWDAPADAAEFAEAFRQYATARFGTPASDEASLVTWQTAAGTHQLRIQNQETTWLFAPQPAQADALWQAIQP